MKRNDLEHQHQSALFRWAAIAERTHPELALIYAVPNEGKRGRRKNPKTGRWYSPEGNKLKAQGMKSGVPDVCLPVARKPYIGLYVEMKAGKNKPTKAQEWWIDQLRKVGHRVEVCYSWTEAKEVIEEYLI